MGTTFFANLKHWQTYIMHIMELQGCLLALLAPPVVVAGILTPLTHQPTHPPRDQSIIVKML
jgi:hypothetical protein